MRVSNSFPLNCAKFRFSTSSNAQDVIELSGLNIHDYKILSEYNLFIPEWLMNRFPFKGNLEIDLSKGLALHGSVGTYEFLKIFVPKLVNNSISNRSIYLYAEDSSLRGVIELTESESRANSVISLVSPPCNGNDIGMVKVHVNEPKPHDDIFLTSNIHSDSLGLSGNYECKIAVNAGVHGTTYIDRNGHMLYLGDFYAET